MSSEATGNGLGGGELSGAKPKQNNILGDKIFRVALTACAAVILLIVLAMIAVMAQSSWLSLKEFGFGFLTELVRPKK